jgi:hypothetical protein
VDDAVIRKRRGRRIEEGRAKEETYKGVWYRVSKRIVTYELR